MAMRPYMVAPDVQTVRKQGQHEMILNAISKKQTFNELIGEANAMVTSVLNDSLKRSLNILPSRVNFGAVKAGLVNEIVISVKNEDMLAQRIVLKQPSDKRFWVYQIIGGPIAPGMTRQIIVEFKTLEATKEETIVNEFQIVSKSDIFKIPIMVTLIPEDMYEERQNESLWLNNRTLIKSNVREKPLSW